MPRPSHPATDTAALAARAERALGPHWLSLLAKAMRRPKSTVEHWIRTGRAPVELAATVAKITDGREAWNKVQAWGRKRAEHRGPVLIVSRDDWSRDLIAAALQAEGYDARPMDPQDMARRGMPTGAARAKREPGDDL